MIEHEEYLLNGPEANLLATDISSKSFNLAVDAVEPPWMSGKLKMALDRSQEHDHDGDPNAHQDPFKQFRINPTEPLWTVADRGCCSQCKKSRKYYCYTCHVPLPSTRDIIPVIDDGLPVRIDVIKHKSEISGKSTAIHAKVICPESVRIFTYPDIPDYGAADERAVLVFPGKTAKSFDELISTEDANARIDRIVFIDSTWNQTKAIIHDDRLSRLPQVKLDGRRTLFWRYQKGLSREYLSTIEAIYYSCLEYHTKVMKKAYHGEYDNVLFLFKFMYSKIVTLYDQEKLLAYQSSRK